MDRAPRELVMRARRRDAVAFSRLVMLYERSALAAAYAVVGEAAAAGDVVQEAFMKAWRSIQELKEPDQFAGWLMRIVRNAAMDHHRSRDRGGSAAELDEGAVVAVAAGPGEVLERGEVSERIDAALGSLDDVTRTVVMLKYYEGLSSREIGEMVGLTTAAVDMRLSRARAELRQQLSPAVDPTGS